MQEPTAAVTVARKRKQKSREHQAMAEAANESRPHTARKAATFNNKFP